MGNMNVTLHIKMRVVVIMKSLKIPKGYSGAVIRRSTDNTMAKRIGTKRQTMVYKTLKNSIEQCEPHKKKPGVNSSALKG